LRYGEKISLGKQPYLAASCITILNFMMDRKNTLGRSYGPATFPAPADK
jgi:hypothetical protein